VFNICLKNVNVCFESTLLVVTENVDVKFLVGVELRVHIRLGRDFNTAGTSHLDLSLRHVFLPDGSGPSIHATDANRTNTEAANTHEHKH